ncbi:MAG TPA: hypothetical protein VJJ77_05085, partial [Dongiaceae bacterium]|nr:hypothetical protein [Dongiaceae bacterium]
AGKRPWLAGLLSALVPGLGHGYAGAWDAAAVALVLDGVLIGSTIELARRELWFTAGATGLAASVFYVGNILSAADLAERRNAVAAAPAWEELERVLVPEAWP